MMSAAGAACGLDGPNDGGGFNLDCTIPTNLIFSGGVSREADVKAAVDLAVSGFPPMRWRVAPN